MRDSGTNHNAPASRGPENIHVKAGSVHSNGALPWREIRSLGEERRTSRTWVGQSDDGPVVVRTFRSPGPDLKRRLALAGALRHPNLPAYETLVESEDAVHWVRPYYPGNDLKGRKLTVEQAWEAAHRVLEALALFHQAGIVHGDLKPSNIIETDARWMVVDPCYDDEDLSTLRYAAPEVTGLLQGQPGPASDLYSFGLVLGELLTGRPLKTASELSALLKQHLQPLPGKMAHIGPGPWSFIRRLCHPDPKQRYQSTEGALYDMARLSDEHSFTLGTRDQRDSLRSPSWTGRIRELQKLEEGLADSSVTTIRVVGEGGFGKSALVRELAQTHDAQFFFIHSDPEGREETLVSLARQLELDVQGAHNIEFRLAQLGSSVLVFDDLQWADEVTLGFIDSLTHKPAPNWKLILLSRPCEKKLPKGDLAIQLTPLTQNETRDFCRSMGGVCDKALTDKIFELSQGVPLMVEACFRGLHERGCLAQLGRGWVETEANDIQVGLASSFLLTHRLANLSSSELKLLQVGALCGRRFPSDVCQISSEAQNLEGALEALRSKHLLWLHDNEHVFVHDRIREEVLATLNPEEAGQLHAKLLDFYQRHYPGNFEEILHHAQGCSKPEVASSVGCSGGTHRHSEQRWQTAEKLLDIALQDPARKKVELFSLTLKRIDCLINLGKDEQANELGRQAEEWAHTKEQRLDVSRLRLANLIGAVSDERFEIAQDALRLLGENLDGNLGRIWREFVGFLVPPFRPKPKSKNIGELADFYIQYTQLAFDAGRLGLIPHAALAAVNRGRDAGGDHMRIQTSYALGNLAILISFAGLQPVARLLCQKSLALVQGFKPEIQSPAFGRASLVALGGGQLALSRQHLARALDYSPSVFGHNFRTALQFSGHTSIFAGDRVAALQCFRPYLNQIQEQTDIHNLATVNLGLTILDEDIPPDWIVDVPGKGHVAERTAQTDLALRHLRANDLFAAIRVLEIATFESAPLLTGFFAGMAPAWLATCYRLLIERLPPDALALKRKILRLTRKATKEALRIGRRFGMTAAHAYRESALLSNLAGNDKQARADFDQSIAYARRVGQPFEIAWTLYSRARIAEAADWPEGSPEITLKTRRFLESFGYFVPELASEPESGAPTLPAQRDRFETLLTLGSKIVLTAGPKEAFQALCDAASELFRTTSVAVVNERLESECGAAQFSREAARRNFEGTTSFLDASTVNKGIASSLYLPIRPYSESTHLLVVTHGDVEGLLEEEAHSAASHLIALTEAALVNHAQFSEQSRLKDEAERTDERFSKLFLQSGLALGVCDRRGQMLAQNETLLEALGPDCISFASRIFPQDVEQFFHLFHNGGSTELCFRDSADTLVWARASVTPLPRDEYLLVLFDVSRTRREELEELHSTEESMLAAELHDGLSAPLVALYYKLQLAKESKEQDPERSRELLAELKSEAQELHGRAQQTSSLLRFANDSDVQAELSSYLDGLSDIKILMQWTANVPPSGLIGPFLSQIIRECVTNARRHSQGDTCLVRVWNGQATLCCEVSDNGKGFSDVPNSRRGLKNIQKRVKLLGGEFSLESASQGTRVRVTLPMSEREFADEQE